jgi:hypothetical protein
MDKKLPDLPPSNDPFWDNAVKIKREYTNTPNCEHSFEYIKSKVGREVKCKICNIGFIFGGSEYLEKGHIYLDGKEIL